MQERSELFAHSVPEQFFDLHKDPDALSNLFHSPEHQELIQQYQAQMVKFMKTSNDPMLEIYEARHDKTKVQAYLARLDSESRERKTKAGYSRNGKAKSSKNKAEKKMKKKG